MKRLRLPRIKITFWRLVFAAIFVTGLYATVIRFGKGLGAASGLSDAFPWGIWIGFDVMCGVALAAGGFTVAAIVYVLHIKRFEPILRPAVLTAFLGYLLVAVSLLYDLGRPYRIWHPMVWGNHHSVMFEVAWCVMLYLTVLALEFSPVVFERFRFGRALKVVHKITPLLVILGVILSTLHQSSLGTLFVIAPNKLHGLWYTPMLPVLFWVSAIAVGLSMTIFESTLSHRAFGVSLHPDLVGSLGKVISGVLAVYLALKLGSLGLRDSLHLALEDSLESRLFLLEMALVVTPMILFLWKRVRKSPQGMFYTAVLVILGVVLNRLNVGITGIERYAGNVYFPTFLEGASTIFVLACGFFAFAVITKYFNIFPAHHASPDEAAAENAPEAEPGAAAPLKLRSRRAGAGRAGDALRRRGPVDPALQHRRRSGSPRAPPGDHQRLSQDQRAQDPRSDPARGLHLSQGREQPGHGRVQPRAPRAAQLQRLHQLPPSPLPDGQERHRHHRVRVRPDERLRPLPQRHRIVRHQAGLSPLPPARAHPDGPRAQQPSPALAPGRSPHAHQGP